MYEHNKSNQLPFAIDPFSSQGQSFVDLYNNEEEQNKWITQQDLATLNVVLAALEKRRDIKITKEQRDFLNKCESSFNVPLDDNPLANFKNFKMMQNAAIFNVLIKIIEEPGSTSEYTQFFLNFLMALDKKEGLKLDNSPLKMFTTRCLQGFDTGKLFQSLEARSYLNRLAESNDPQLFMLFDGIARHTGGKYKANFFRAAKCTLQIYNYFRAHNINLNIFIENRGVFLKEPQRIMDYLVKTKHNHSALFDWVKEHLNGFLDYHPSNETNENIKNYSFIHQAMCFDSCEGNSKYFQTNLAINIQKNKFSISKQQLNDLRDTSPPSKGKDQKEDFLVKRALFLRYLASQVQDQHEAKALETWENNIGLLTEENPEFTSEQWKLMVDTALSLPTRLAVEDPGTFGETVTADNLAAPKENNAVSTQPSKAAKKQNPDLRYSMDELDCLIETLYAQDNKVQKSLLEVREIVEDMNNHICTYYDMPADLLLAQDLFLSLTSGLERDEESGNRFWEACYGYASKFDGVELSNQDVEKRLTFNIWTIIEVYNRLKSKFPSGEKPDFESFKNSASADITYQSLKRSNDQKSWRQLSMYLSLLRETYRRSTASSSSDGTGKWLRLEQVIEIILGYREKIALQIDTSEGKTLILSCIAMLHVLFGEKVDVLTHQELFSQNGQAEASKLAECFGVNVAAQSTAFEKPDKSIDILYVDISTAISAKLLNDLKLEKQQASSSPLSFEEEERKATVGLIDEGDNIVLDIQANTTVQISEHTSEEASKNLILVLTLFQNYVKRFPNVLNLDLNTNAAIKSEFEKFSNFLLEPKTNYLFNFEDFCFWLNAAKLSQNLKQDIDYVLQKAPNSKGKLAVHIVHYKTTGRVDKMSKWGEGVHTYISLREQLEKSQDNKDIVVPDIGKTLRKSTVAEYLKSYNHLSLFSGTLGSEKAVDTIKTMINSDKAIRFPRAKRPETEEFAWPRVLKETKQTLPLPDVQVNESILSNKDQITENPVVEIQEKYSRA